MRNFNTMIVIIFLYWVTNQYLKTIHANLFNLNLYYNGESTSLREICLKIELNQIIDQDKIDHNLLQQHLNKEKIDLLYKNLFTSVPASLFCATIILVSFYRVPHSYILIDWYVAMVALSVLRLALAGYFMHTHNHDNNSRYYLFILTTGLTALLWGYVGSLLMPENYLIEQMVAIIVIAGVTAGGIQSLNASFLCCLLYTVLSVLPLALWIFYQENTAYNILGFAMSVYLLFLIIISWRSHQFLNETIKIKNENIETNKQLNKMNHTLIEQENNLHMIHDNAPIGMAIVSLDGKWINVNNKLCELVGYTKNELEQTSTQNLVYKKDLKIDEGNKAKLLNGKLSSYQVEKRFVRKNGQLIWMLANISLVRDKENKPLYYISQIQDINERKQNEVIMSTLSNMNEMLLLCHDSSEAYPIIGHTAERLFVDLCGGLAKFNKLSNEMETVASFGKNPLLTPSFNVSECWAMRSCTLYEVKDPDSSLLCRHFTSKPPGGYICLPLIVQNETLGMLNFSTAVNQEIASYQQKVITNFSEIIKLSLANIHLNEALREQAIHDTLTGLVNRRYLHEWFPKILQHIILTQNVLSLCMIDLDFFKKINDTYGHDAGDEVLKQIAKVLKESVRESDIVARYGGEEFVLALIGSNSENAIMQMEKLRNVIKNTKIYTHDKELLPQITISIGIAEAPKFGTTMSELLRVSDTALYTAKENGKDRVVAAS